MEITNIVRFFDIFNKKPKSANIVIYKIELKLISFFILNNLYIEI